MATGTQNRWYSPQTMLLFADMALEHCRREGMSPSASLRHAIDEGRTGAIFALGLEAVLGTQCWLRLTDPSERAPDVRLVYFDDQGPKGSHRMNTIDIEVATFTRHSPESLGEFIYATKLDPSRKAYGARTVLAFNVQRGCMPAELRQAHELLAGRATRGLCYLVGKVDEDQHQVVEVFPALRGPVNVSLSQAFADDRAPVINVKRGMSTVTRRSERPEPTPNPYLAYQQRAL